MTTYRPRRTVITRSGYQVVDHDSAAAAAASETGRPVSPESSVIDNCFMTSGERGDEWGPAWKTNISSFAHLTFSATSNTHIINRQDVPVIYPTTHANQWHPPKHRGSRYEITSSRRGKEEVADYRVLLVV